jgi:hypothetical protein
LLAASVAAIASWPLYARFSARVRKHVGKHVTAFMFTAIITAFVLAPLVFALWSLLSESHVLLRQIAGADEKGIVLPQWLQGLPLVGSWQGDLSSPGALLRLDPPDQRDGVSGAGAVARSVRGSAPADPPVHDPAALLPLRPGRIAGA